MVRRSWQLACVLCVWSSCVLSAWAGEVPRPAGWQWWHGLWFHRDGTPRYAEGLAYDTTHHQHRLPVCPPLSEPIYGYHPPCWRQLAVIPRCVSNETMPQGVQQPAWGRRTPTTSENPPSVPPRLNPEVPAPTVPLPPPAPSTSGKPPSLPAFSEASPFRLSTPADTGDGWRPAASHERLIPVHHRAHE